jgi:hypothetical protein
MRWTPICFLQCQILVIVSDSDVIMATESAEGASYAMNTFTAADIREKWQRDKKWAKNNIVTCNKYQDNSLSIMRLLWNPAFQFSLDEI